MANDVTKSIKLGGTLKSAFNHTEKDDNGNVVKSTNVVSLFIDGAKIDGKDGVKEFFDDFFKGKNAKWIPDWYKSGKDYLSVKSSYNIPVMLDFEENKPQMSFAEFVERGNIRGAKIIVKCNVKESAIYPNAIMVVEDGEPYDAFADF